MTDSKPSTASQGCEVGSLNQRSKESGEALQRVKSRRSVAQTMKKELSQLRSERETWRQSTIANIQVPKPNPVPADSALSAQWAAVRAAASRVTPPPSPAVPAPSTPFTSLAAPLLEDDNTDATSKTASPVPLATPASSPTPFLFASPPSSSPVIPLVSTPALPTSLSSALPPRVSPLASPQLAADPSPNHFQDFVLPKRARNSRASGSTQVRCPSSMGPIHEASSPPTLPLPVAEPVIVDVGAGAPLSISQQIAALTRKTVNGMKQGIPLSVPAVTTSPTSDLGDDISLLRALLNPSQSPFPPTSPSSRMPLVSLQQRDVDEVELQRRFLKIRKEGARVKGALIMTGKGLSREDERDDIAFSEASSASIKGDLLESEHPDLLASLLKRSPKNVIFPSKKEISEQEENETREVVTQLLAPEFAAILRAKDRAVTNQVAKHLLLSNRALTAPANSSASPVALNMSPTPKSHSPHRAAMLERLSKTIDTEMSPSSHTEDVSVVVTAADKSSPLKALKKTTLAEATSVRDKLMRSPNSPIRPLPSVASSSAVRSPRSPSPSSPSTTSSFSNLESPTGRLFRGRERAWMTEETPTSSSHVDPTAIAYMKSLLLSLQHDFSVKESAESNSPTQDMDEEPKPAINLDSAKKKVDIKEVRPGGPLSRSLADSIEHAHTQSDIHRKQQGLQAVRDLLRKHNDKFGTQ